MVGTQGEVRVLMGRRVEGVEVVAGKIGKAADLVLCLFPFEPQFYNGHNVPAAYVGHPMADQISADFDPVGARTKLGLEPSALTVGLLPGSRVSEAERLSEPMIDATRLLASRYPGVQFVAAIANEKVRNVFQESISRLGVTHIHLVEQQPRTVIAAADAVMSASGTATLETMLVNRPLVMTYRLAGASYQLAKSLRLFKIPRFALPNILAGELLVPELIQNEATSERLAEEIGKWLDDKDACAHLQQQFLALHEQLRCDASQQAASAVAGLLDS